MWNQKRSITLSKICVVIFTVAAAAVAVRAGWLVGFLTLKTDPGVLPYYDIHGMRPLRGSPVEPVLPASQDR